MIDRRKSLITPKKPAENRNGLQDDTGGSRASWQSDGRAAGAVTTILAPAIIWQGPFGPRHVDSFRTPAINRQTVSQGFLAKIYHFWMNGWSFSTYESYIKIWCRYHRELWQHLEGGRASGLRRCRHLWKSRCAVALLMNIAVYIIDNLQVIEVTKMELKQILKDDDHTSNWGKGRGGSLQ